MGNKYILYFHNFLQLLLLGIPHQYQFFQLFHHGHLSFLLFLNYYVLFFDYEDSLRQLGILTTTFLSGIALYFSAERPQPNKMTTIDLIFIWYYIQSGVISSRIEVEVVLWCQCPYILHLLELHLNLSPISCMT